MAKKISLFLILLIILFNITSAQLREVKTYYDYQRTIINEKYTVDDKTGQKEGAYKKYSSYGGVLIDGTFSRNKMFGKWVYKNDQGQIYQIENYNSAGQLHGIYEGMIQPSFGEYDLGRYDNGKKVGTWITYYGNKGGNIRRREKFVAGESVSDTAYYSDGKVQEDCSSMKIIIAGVPTVAKVCNNFAQWEDNYFPTGQTWYIGREKVREVVYENGNLKRDDFYLPSIDSGYIKNYTPNGKLRKEHSYQRFDNDANNRTPTYICKSYYDSGSLLDSISTDSSGKYIRWAFTEDGVLFSKAEVEPTYDLNYAYRCGSVTEYYKNGRVKLQAYFSCSQRLKENTVGVWREYDENGILIKETQH